MLARVNKALLLSDVPAFYNSYKALAEDIGVELKCEEQWNRQYRVNTDVLIAGSKYLPDINESSYPYLVIILKDGENPFPYIQKGITRFIFNFRNNFELMCALYNPEKIIVHACEKELETVLRTLSVHTYHEGNYDFDFDLNQFSYKGKKIYISKASKMYLAEWLLNGNKDNSKRMVLCNLRKKLGSEFLADVDRFGKLRKEETK